MVAPIRPREGDIAFAVSVATLYDLTIGQVGWPVRLTKHSHPTAATLTLANQTPGGPILDIVEFTTSGGITTSHSILRVNKNGIAQAQIGGWLDFFYQTSTPPAPGAGTDVLRLYARDDGRLYFRSEASTEQAVDTGGGAGGGEMSLRWSYWMGG